ncbi:MAG: cell wall-binding repeat-containing protein, partial [Finegoldia magna]|nr:cell wall-binding repeat-containing protein [Finegoldia magna]
MKHFNNFKIIALAFLLSVSISQPTSAIKQIEKVSIEGKKRYETAIQISKKSYPRTSDTVIIVNSEKIADSLSVGVLAHKINSPILLTDHDEINQSTLKEIQRLKTTNIILVGGTQSISKSQETNLINQGYKVRRIYGKDRIDTSFSIATELSNLNQTKQFDNAFVVHATKSIVDSASVSAAACSMNSPILFVGNDTKSFEEKYSNYTFNNTYLIGGATAKLSKNFPNSKIIYGKNRNDTSMIIADTFFKDTKSVFLAKNGEQRFSELIDCVTVAPFAANEKSPIIFASTKNNLTQSEKNFFDKLNPNKITLVGGGLHPKFDEIIGKTPPKKEYVLLNVSQINQNKAGLLMG